MGFVLTIHCFVWPWQFESGAGIAMPVLCSWHACSGPEHLAHPFAMQRARVLHTDAQPGCGQGGHSIPASLLDGAPPEPPALRGIPDQLGFVVWSMLWWEPKGLWVHMQHSQYLCPSPVWPLVSIRESISCLVNYSFFLAIFVSVQSQLGTLFL